MTAPTFPADVVERVARVAFGIDPHEMDEWYTTANDLVLVVLSALSPSAQAVVRGEAVAVPKEATDAMIHAGRSPDQGFYTKSPTAEFMGIWRRMIAASPYAQEPTP